MAGHRIGATIALDGEKQFKQAVAGVNKELNNLKSQSALVEAQFEGQANTAEALRAKHEILTKTLEAQKRKEEEVEKGLRHARESYESIGNQLNTLRGQYDAAVSRMEELKRTSGATEAELEEQRRTVEELARTIERGERNYERASNRINRWEIDLNNARTQTIQANRALEENIRYLQEAEESVDGCCRSIDEYGNAVQEAEDATVSWGDALKVAVADAGVEMITDAVKSLGEATVGTAQEMVTSLNQLQASTGAASDVTEAYGKVMDDIFKNNYGNDFEDIGDAVSTVVQNLGQIDPTSLQETTESAITLRDVFGFDYQEQIRAVKMLTDTFGISSKKAFNLVAQGAQQGLNKNGDLLDVINEYSVHYKQMGASADDFFNSLANGTAAGTFSVDKLGDAYKEFGIRVKDTAASTTEGYNLIGVSADEMRMKFVAGGEAAQEATNTVLTALFNMDDQVKQNQAGVALFGTMWEDLGLEGVKALMNLNGEISMTKDTMESIQNIKYDDMTNSLTSFTRNLQMKIAEPLAKKYLPIMNKGVEALGDNLDVACTAAIGLSAAIATYKIAKSDIFISLASSVKKLTTATEGATIAQKALNLAQNMSPLGVTLTAIGLLTGGVMAYQAATKDATDVQDEFVDSMNEKRTAIEDSIQSYRDSVADVETEWAANQKLIDKLWELNEVQGKTVGQKAEMKGIVDQLAEDIPELADAYNAETGALNITKDALDGIITKRKEYALAVASQDALQDLAKQVVDAENMITETQKKIESRTEHLQNLKDRLGNIDFDPAAWWDINKAITETEKEIEQLNEELGEHQFTQNLANDALDEAVKKSNEYSEALSESTETVEGFSEAETQAAANTSQMTAEQIEAYNEMQRAIADSIGSSVSLLEEFSGGTEITAQELNNNLESQIQGISAWSENMKTLAGAAGEGMSEEFYNYLLDMGPQSANLVQSLVDALNNDAPLFKEICENWSDAMDIEGSLSGGLTDAYNVGFNISMGVSEGMTDGVPHVQEAANNLTAGVMDVLQSNMKIHSPSQETREKIGIMISRGLALGILDGIPETRLSVSDLCKSVLGTAEKELDIHSPSRTFRDRIGANISRGVAFGISAKKGEAIKESKLLANDVYKSASKWLASYKRNHTLSLEDEKAFWNKVAGTVKKGTTAYRNALEKASDMEEFMKKMRKQTEACFNVSEYTTNSKGEQEKKSVEDYYGEIYSTASKYFDNYSVIHNVSLQEEEYFWSQVRKQLKSGTQAYYDATKKLKEIKKERKQSLQAEKEEKKDYALSGDALSKYKTYYQVSEKAEMQYWNTVRKKYKKGTAERIEADQKYYEAKAQYNSKLEELNQEYYDNCKEVNDKLEEDVRSLTDTYNSAVSDRKDAIYSSFGLFDQFESMSSSGQTLLYNLKTQVAGIADWEQQLSKLGNKNILSEGLMAELAAMGPEASASIHALNQLTDAELQEYQQLWEQKNALAESQAIKENETLKSQTETQIEQLKTSAQQQLNAYKSAYESAAAEVNKAIEEPLKKLAQKANTIGEDAAVKYIAGIKRGATKKSTKADLKVVTTTVSDELGTLKATGKTIGDNTLQGIIDGLTNKKKIDSSAKDLIDALKKSIQKAADIHSPSRLFKKEVGVQISAGVAEGIEDQSRAVNTAGEDMIKDLLESSRQQLIRQQAALNDYATSVQSSVGMKELNNLISVAPVQQVTATVDNSALIGMFGEMLAVMQEGFERVGNMQLVADTGALIGEISTGMSEAFAMNARRLR